MIITLPNFLSLIRIPLAFAFLHPSTTWRLFALLAAACSDFFDGYLARRYKMCSRIGTTLDPITDKFFVLFVLSIFYSEGLITLFEATSMLCRDLAVIVFGFYLILSRHWNNYAFRAIWCGKITTTLQLLVLFALTYHIPLPEFTYTLFIVLGLLALGELKINAKLT